MKFQVGKIRHPKSILIPLGIILLAISTTFYLKDQKTSSPPVIQESSTVTYSTDNPSEEKPGNDYKWSGKTGEPKYIRLSSIHTEGYIQNVGIDQNKQVAVPNNIHLAGWFRDSVIPGEKGLSIIDGHVDGRASAGIFKNLGNLKQGDEFTVEMGSGSLKTFRVKKVSTIDTNAAVNILFSQDPQIESQLNLITCGGTFNKQARQYDKRVIVVSELINK